jgi:crotonobetainyl-CoA:carnitine CoA-transferase CaiB-like acyl-CoA transferase
LACEPIELAGSPFHLHGAELPTPTMPPRLGEHTDEILRAVLGLDAAR